MVWYGCCCWELMEANEAVSACKHSSYVPRLIDVISTAIPGCRAPSQRLIGCADTGRNPGGPCSW